jgi:N-acetylglucosamine kinase-like BadF-type ATPase
MRCALAIDGGGSKTDAVVVDERGQVLGWGRGGPMHSYYSTPEEVQASYRAALTQALGEVQADSFCVSDVLGRHGMLDELVMAHGPVAAHVSGCEVETAFASVQETWGLVVLSGTGSFVYGRTPEGQRKHFGGLGPVLGDYGSAYAVGLRGLRAAFASQWAPRRKTTLETELLKVYDLPDLHAIFNRVYQQGLSRRETAASARVVNQQAEAGDRVAAQCLTDAADELAEVALDIVDGLQMQDMSFPMIAVGSVAQNSRLWWQRMCERVQAVAPHVRPMIPQVRPVIGGALLALRELGVDWTPELLATICQTQEPFLQRLEQTGSRPC